MAVRRLARLLAGVLLLAAVLPRSAWAQRYQPSLDFETIATPHFLIHFHQNERAVAARLAAFVEDVRASLLAGRSGPARVHVIVSGQDDIPNGWATTVPFNVIEIRTVWPRPSSGIGHSTDWLRLVFTHEYAHILHLDRSAGIFGLARRVFGRVPFAMPNLFLPIWQVEGIATWRESVTTGTGRVNDGTVRRTLAAAASAGRFEPIDRAGGGLVTWPGGDAAYQYGGLFHDYLSARFGADALERLSTETARWPPFFGRFAFGRVFGASPEAVWRDFRSSWASPVSPASPDDTRAMRVTHDGFQTSAPRWDPARPGTLYYARRTPHAFPSIQRVDAATGAVTAVADQFLGESLSSRGSRLIFDQLDTRENVALVQDLYLVDVVDGVNSSRSPRRLTRGARAGDPDLSPDGGRIAFVVTAPDRRSLVTLTIADTGTPGAIVPLVSEAGVYFSRPRWSPDGTRIAAERQRDGRESEIVVVDLATKTVEVVAPGVAGRQATPAWGPDGEVIVFAAAVDSEPFNLVAVTMADRRVWRVTSRLTGARAPDVSPDGTRVAFLGYTADGEDVFVQPLDRSAWQPIAASGAESPAPTTAAMTAAPAASAARSYSPLHGFIPRYWSPVFEAGDDGVAIGAATSGVDALGRHAYDVVARVWSETRETDVDVAYSYRRWRPWLFGSFSREAGTVEEGVLRSHTASAGVVLPMITVRRTEQFVGLFRGERLGLDHVDGRRLTFTRNAVRLGWQRSSARGFGYSVTPEEGWAMSVAGELVREAIGADGRSDALLADWRGYQRFGPRHAALALRAAGAASRGDRDVRPIFGIANTGPVAGPLAFDRDAVALFRGSGVARIAGTRSAVANIDYRFPIWRVERGVGAYPAFLRWFHGAAFLDAADAWAPGRTARVKVAAGVEAAADIVLGHTLPLTLAAGVSWRLDSMRPDNAPHVFARVGRSF